MRQKNPQAWLLAAVLSMGAAAWVQRSASQESERTLAPREWDQTIAVALGSILVVPRPTSAAEWSVAYAAEVLEMLTPAERQRNPDAEGWRFRAIGSGETAVTFTTVPSCPGQRPCSAPPQRFQVTIQVESRGDLR